MHVIPTSAPPQDASPHYEFLLIDQFLKTEIAAAALRAAFEMGVIDCLIDGDAQSESLPVRDPQGSDLLLKLLAANNVIVRESPAVSLSEAFRSILPFRNLLEAKLAFAAKVEGDISSLLPALLDNPQAFMARSKTFEIFRYDRCMNVTPDNVAVTKEWMRFTTALTRYEAQAFLDTVDLSAVRRMMDLGGNSGEFVLQLCRRHPNLAATVFDLPVVASIGHDHVAGEPEATRVAFRSGDMRRDALPGGFDLVTFKSVLHDWPDEDAHRLLAKAKEAVRPGGGIAIFERGPLTVPAEGLPYWMLPNLVFFRFFRPATFYKEALGALGMDDIRVETVRLEMDFHVITATKTN